MTELRIEPSFKELHSEQQQLNDDVATAAWDAAQRTNVAHTKMLAVEAKVTHMHELAQKHLGTTAMDVAGSTSLGELVADAFNNFDLLGAMAAPVMLMENSPFAQKKKVEVDDSNELLDHDDLIAELLGHQFGQISELEEIEEKELIEAGMDVRVEEANAWLSKLERKNKRVKGELPFHAGSFGDETGAAVATITSNLSSYVTIASPQAATMNTYDYNPYFDANGPKHAERLGVHRNHWRMLTPGHENGRLFVVSLKQIVEAMPGKFADWAIATQETMIRKLKAELSVINENQDELVEATHDLCQEEASWSDETSNTTREEIRDRIIAGGERKASMLVLLEAELSAARGN